MAENEWDGKYQRVWAGQFVWAQNTWVPATPNSGGGGGGTVTQGPAGADAWPVTFLTPPTVDVGTVPVTGTFWQATQPVSGTVTALQGTPASANAWPVTIINQPIAVSTGAVGTKSQVCKNAILTTTSVAADQEIVSHTVTAGKTFYLTYLKWASRRTIPNATAARLGSANLEYPSGTKLITEPFNNPTVSIIDKWDVTFAEPLMATSGVVRVVCSPSDATSTQWYASFGGYEL